MQARSNGVLQVIALSRISVGEVPHVAVEAAITNQGLYPGALGGVVAIGRHDGRVAGFNVGDDVFGVGGEDVGDESGEIGIIGYGAGDEELRFVEDVGED